MTINIVLWLIYWLSLTFCYLIVILDCFHLTYILLLSTYLVRLQTQGTCVTIMFPGLWLKFRYHTLCDLVTLVWILKPHEELFDELLIWKKNYYDLHKLIILCLILAMTKQLYYEKYNALLFVFRASRNNDWYPWFHNSFLHGTVCTRRNFRK